MKKILFILVIVVTLSAAIFFLQPDEETIDTLVQVETGSIQESPIVQPTPDSKGISTYRDDEYGFTLQFPQEYRISKIEGEESDTVLLQDSSGVGMQIIIAPFDEPIRVLTEARIREDLPDLPMQNVAETSLPAAGIPVLAFKSSGGGFGESIEAWFIHDGHLYQASSYLSGAPFLDGVLAAMKW